MKTDIKMLRNKLVQMYKNTNVKMLLSAFVLFFSVLLYIPQSSVVRSLPVILFFGALAFFVYPNLKYNLGILFSLSFVFHIVYANSLFDSILLSLLLLFYFMCSVLVLILVLKYSKEKSKSNKKRCILYILVCFSCGVLVYTLMCGNIFSAISSHNQNVKYIRKNYGDKITVMHTSLDFRTQTYRTYIQFVDGGYNVGVDETRFVSEKSDKITDGYRDYFEDKMLKDSNVILTGIIENATDAFEIAQSEIEFENGEVLSQTPDCREYFDRTSYVVAFYSIVNTKDEFLKLSEDCIAELSKQDEFAFEKIIFCAGNASEFKYILEYTPEMTENEIDEKIVQYSDKLLKNMGVTQKKLLEFWQNK